ncbi:hypothetical protein KCU65_g2309, partial [Aureobasidium melanogenum]
MTSKENVPPGDLVGKKNTPVNYARHEYKVPASDQKSLPRLMGPLAIRSNNISCPPPVEERHSPEIAKASAGEALSIPEGSKFDRDDVKQEIQPEQEDNELSDAGSPDNNIDGEDEDGDGYDFDLDDDNISIDDDQFFGDPASEVAPRRPTEEQMDAIQKTMEEDEKAAKQAYEEQLSQEAIRKALEEDVEPPALISNDDAPDPIVPPHPLLTDQNYNATEMLISIRSSLAGDVFHIVGVTEPLGKMKIKFVQAVNLSPSELSELEFLCGYHVIQDDDTVEKLMIGPESIIYCQKIGAMRYDLPLLPPPDSANSD